MKVRDAMSRSVEVASPQQTIGEIAGIMERQGIGVLPVGDNDRLVGMITDRDIVVRGVAHGKGPEAPVRDVMTPEVKYCYEDDDLEKVARNMGDLQVRRLPVINRDKRLVGIVSLGDVARTDDDSAGDAVAEISQPGGAHAT
jgi:CBS domain-containing protein